LLHIVVEIVPLQHRTLSLGAPGIFELRANFGGPVRAFERERQRLSEYDSTHPATIFHRPVDSEVDTPVMSHQDDLLTEFEASQQSGRIVGVLGKAVGAGPGIRELVLVAGR
jgi:hypothetical protein